MSQRMVKHDLVKLWDVSPLWETLTEEERMLVEQNITTHVFRKNEIIHHEGDMPTHIMVLITGKIKLFKEGAGRSQIIRMQKPYDLFAYRAVIAGDRYNTTVSALETSIVYMLRKDLFLRLLQQNNRFCFRCIVTMSHELGNSDTRTVTLTQKHIRGRLAEALLSLKKTYGVEGDGATISMYLSREDLANLSNMTTSNAIRTLAGFVNDELISVDGRKIKILDLDGLVRVSRLG